MMLTELSWYISVQSGPFSLRLNIVHQYVLQLYALEKFMQIGP